MKKLFILFALVTLTARSQQWNGLTYYSNMGSSTGYLIDTNSVTQKTWTFSVGTGYSTHMMPGGFIWRTCTNSNVLTGGGMTGRIQKLDYAGTILWDYTYSTSTYCIHHDHCPLPNGNVLVISYDVRNATDIANAGCTTSLTTIWAEKILELQPTGLNTANIVWQWNVWDHTCQSTDNTKTNYVSSVVNNPQLLNVNYMMQKDWMHMNGIDYNPVLDQISLSSHNLNEWYVIDHSTSTAQAATHVGGIAGKGGDFLYRWGNPPAYQAAGTKILNVTHDAHWIPEGSPNAGYLVAVNNGGATGPKTTIDQVSVPRSGFNYTITSGNAYSPASYTLRHTSTGYTSNMGSSDQFPNGNQMVCLATAGQIYEIDALGNVLWSKATSGSTPQSHRYTTCFINNAAPSAPTISASGNTLTSTSGVTYQWYFNGDAIPLATNQSYVATQNGYYLVRITDVNGCVYVYSSNYPYGVSTGIDQVSLKSKFDLFPNPTNGIVTINEDYFTGTDYDVTVYDSFGKELFKIKNAATIDLGNLNAGVYFVSVIADNGTHINQKICLVK